MSPAAARGTGRLPGDPPGAGAVPRVVLAPDSFKGSLGAAAVAHAMAEGVLAAHPGAQVLLRPIADGGEGFVDAVVTATGATVRTVRVHDALGVERTARLALDADTCYLEVADAVGLTHLDPSPSTALAADSAGVGELILAALDAGAAQVVVGLGGSATTDGGAGMLRALGARLLRPSGEPLGPGGGGLRSLDSADLTGLDPRLREVRLVAAHDVTSPLLGPHGAAAVYGPQKGADPGTVSLLEAGLARLVEVLRRDAGVDLDAGPGAGAAGGLGGALHAVLGARLRSGADLVLGMSDLDRDVAGATVVITGEGSFDEQSLQGKGPAAVVAAAARAGVPVAVVAGRCGLARGSWERLGVHAVLALDEEYDDPFHDTAARIGLLTARVVGLLPGAGRDASG